MRLYRRPSRALPNLFKGVRLDPDYQGFDNRKTRLVDGEAKVIGICSASIPVSLIFDCPSSETDISACCGIEQERPYTIFMLSGRCAIGTAIKLINPCSVDICTTY